MRRVTTSMSLLTLAVSALLFLSGCPPDPVGSLTVTILPAEAATAGAQWQVDGGPWQDAGATVTGLSVAGHTVAFSTVSGYEPPAGQSVTVTAGATATATGTYQVSGPDDPGWNQAAYDQGFSDGFMVDEEYWQGFDDSYDTRDAGPIYYSGGEIPYQTSPAYDAGYWDGVWYAYNDGYFVEYDYAFTIGFSEGYDLAFWPDWVDFLTNDEHLEYLDGGFTDGYNDGFSEGRVLGAYDYSSGLPYDWLDAMMYYREGNDVYLAEVGFGTGADGPVELYVYGTDPNGLVKESADRAAAVTFSGGRAIRRSATDTAKGAKITIPDISYRTLPDNERARFNVAPGTSPRSTAALDLKTTWAQRIDAYQAAQAGK